MQQSQLYKIALLRRRYLPRVGLGRIRADPGRDGRHGRDPEKDIAMLDRYPRIKNIFLKYNTPIPTSAFSAKRLTVRRNHLSY